MKLFSADEIQRIKSTIGDIETKAHYVVAFRNKYGPTKLVKLWKGVLSELGIKPECVSWWSSSGTIGLLECESESGVSIYGQWVVADENELLSVFEVDSKDLTNIKEGFDAGNVTSFAMRAIRIGETGDRD